MINCLTRILSSINDVCSCSKILHKYKFTVEQSLIWNWPCDFTYMYLLFCEGGAFTRNKIPCFNNNYHYNFIMWGGGVHWQLEHPLAGAVLLVLLVGRPGRGSHGSHSSPQLNSNLLLWYIYTGWYAVYLFIILWRWIWGTCNYGLCPPLDHLG